MEKTKLEEMKDLERLIQLTLENGTEKSFRLCKRESELVVEALGFWIRENCGIQEKKQ